MVHKVMTNETGMIPAVMICSDWDTNCVYCGSARLQNNPGTGYIFALNALIDVLKAGLIWRVCLCFSFYCENPEACRGWRHLCSREGSGRRVCVYCCCLASSSPCLLGHLLSDLLIHSSLHFTPLPPSMSIPLKTRPSVWMSETTPTSCIY